MSKIKLKITLKDVMFFLSLLDMVKYWKWDFKKRTCKNCGLKHYSDSCPNCFPKQEEAIKLCKCGEVKYQKICKCNNVE